MQSAGPCPAVSSYSPAMPSAPACTAAAVTYAPPTAVFAPSTVSSYSPPGTATGGVGSYTPLPQITTSVAASAGASCRMLPGQSCPSSVTLPMSDPTASSEERNLTRGIPDPSAIESQREAYSRSLEHQLEQGNLSLQEQHKARKQQLYNAAQQRKQALLLQVEQQMRMEEMALDEQTNQAMLGLKKAALDQRAALDQQAAGLTLEYQQRKMQEEFAATQAEIQRQYMESHLRLQQEVNRHQNAPPVLIPPLATGGHPYGAAGPIVVTPPPQGVLTPHGVSHMQSPQPNSRRG